MLLLVCHQVSLCCTFRTLSIEVIAIGFSFFFLRYIRYHASIPSPVANGDNPGFWRDRNESELACPPYIACNYKRSEAGTRAGFGLQ